jgi:hypothetical protein
LRVAPVLHGGTAVPVLSHPHVQCGLPPAVVPPVRVVGVDGLEC